MTNVTALERLRYLGIIYVVDGAFYILNSGPGRSFDFVFYETEYTEGLSCAETLRAQGEDFRRYNEKMGWI